MMGFGNEADLVDLLVRAADGRRVLLSAGWAGLGSRRLPEGVHVIGATPHDWLFPRCAAALHHCGAGTSHSAARAGVPTVPVPIVADQPFWAARLRDLGIATEPVDRRRPDESRIQASIAEATAAPMRERAAAVAARMASEDGVSTAVEAIERLVAQPSR